MHLPKISIWKYEFEPRVLERGYGYYCSGLIDQVQKTILGWTAVVHGSEDYDVHIVMSPKKVLDLHCSCPYAKNGAHCKHEAALLYQVTEEDDPVHPEQKKAEVFRENLFDKRNRSEQSSEELAKDIYWALIGLEEDYSENGYIDWRSGADYADEFCNILNDYLEPLFEEKRYEAAFHCLDKAFMVINMTELDGSFGEYSKVGDEIAEYWIRVVRAVSPEERKEVRSWFEELREKGWYLTCSDVITSVLKTAFDNTELH